MAKSRKLLLTALLAVVCLVASLCATLLPAATPARAAEYEYVKTTFPTASDTPVLMLGKYNNVYYAVTEDGSSLKTTAVTVEGDKVTSPVTDSMLWIVGKSGFYFTYKSVSKGTYLNLADWSVSLSSTAGTFYNGNPLQTTAGNEKFLSITSASVTYNANAGTPIEAFAQTEKQVSATEKTITFNKGSETATGTMADAKWDTASGDYILPACSFANEYYAFNGWKIGDSEEIKEAGETITLTDDITLTAVWEYNAWDITFKMDGKTDVVKHVEKGAEYSVPDFTGIFSSSDLPEGKLFAKWQDDEGNDYFKNAKHTFDKNMELTPVFGEKIIVTYDFNGGHQHTGDGYNMFPETRTDEYAAGSVQKITTSYNPQRENYTLTGWKCGDLVVKSGVEFTVADEDMCFVAQWKFDGITLVFNDGTSTSNIELASGTSSYTIAVNDPAAPAGQKFIGWQIEGDESGTLYGKNISDHKTIAIDGDEMKLNAVYRDLKTYTVTLHYGQITKELQFTEDTENIQFNSATFTDNEMGVIDDDHTFKGWYKDEAFTTQMSTSYLAADDSFEGLHLYAKIDAYFWVHFDYGFKANETDETNIIVDEKAAESSQGVTALSKDSGAKYYARDKFTLLGWATEVDGAVVYAADGRTYVSTPCTLYAVWDYNYYVITVKLAGSETPVGTVEVAKNRNGNTLVKINELKDSNDALVINWTAVNVEGKDATWTVIKGEEEGRDTAVNEQITLTSDITLQVRFSDHIYTITINWIGGKLAEIKQAYNTDVTAPETNKAGYTFVAFYLNNESGGEYTFDKMPSQDIVVWAKYEILDSTLKFDTSDGSEIADITQKTGTQVDKPADPTKEGYEFKGWLINGQLVTWLVKEGTGTTTNPEYYINMPGGETTMVAKWELTAEGLAAIKAAKLAELDAYVTEKDVELPESYSEAISNATTEAGVNEALTAAKAKVDELKAEKDAAAQALADAKTAAKAEVAAKALEDGVTAPSTEAIDAATTIEQVNAAKAAALEAIAQAKADKEAAEAAQALADAKTAAKAEVAAKALEDGVTAPSTEAIDAATTIEQVNAAKAAALEAIAQAKADKEAAEAAAAESKARVDAAKAKIAALSGKKGAELFAAIKEADTAIAALTADEKAQLDMTGYNSAKTAYNAYVAASSADLDVAADIGMSVAAVKLASAVTAIAALVLVLKRRMF